MDWIYLWIEFDWVYLLYYMV